MNWKMTWWRRILVGCRRKCLTWCLRHLEGQTQDNDIEAEERLRGAQKIAGEASSKRERRKLRSEIAAWLRSEMKRKGVTVGELAYRLEVDEERITASLQGEHPLWFIDVLGAMAILDLYPIAALEELRGEDIAEKLRLNPKHRYPIAEMLSEVLGVSVCHTGHLTSDEYSFHLKYSGQPESCFKTLEEIEEMMRQREFPAEKLMELLVQIARWGAEFGVDWHAVAERARRDLPRRIRGRVLASEGFRGLRFSTKGKDWAKLLMDAPPTIRAEVLSFLKGDAKRREMEPLEPVVSSVDLADEEGFKVVLSTAGLGDERGFSLESDDDETDLESDDEEAGDPSGPGEEAR